MAPSDALEARHSRVQRFVAVTPYVLLATSAGLSWSTDEQRWESVLLTLGLTVLAAAWLWFMATRRKPDAVFVVGLIVCIALLGLRDVWFATLFGFTGYLYSWNVLRDGWRIVGVSATAAITAAAVMGDALVLTPVAVLTFVLFIAVIVVLVSAFSMLGDITSARSESSQRMVAQLERTIEENAALHAQLLAQARDAGVHEERQRIAREIHDTLAQGLVGIVTQLQAAERMGTAGDREAWQHHIDRAMRMARDGLAEARRSVHAMTPGELVASQLPDAVDSVADEWRQGRDVRLCVSTTGDVRPLHADVELTLLRVLQEALTNIAAHAAATRVGVTLSYMDDQVTLDIRDDGIGFDEAASGGTGGYGLTSMRQRVLRLGGVLDIEAVPGAGVAVSASVPAVRDGRALEAPGA